MYPLKRWSASKTRDLRVLRKLLGADLVSSLNHTRIVEVFTDMHAGGAGGVGISVRIGYLIRVLETAANLWRLGALEAVRDARAALKEHGMITVSKQRDRMEWIRKYRCET